MAVEKTDVSMLSKVKALGASFFQKYVTTKDMNKKLTELNNIGLRDIIVATSTSTTTDFGSLKVGDKVMYLPAALGEARFFTVATAGTLPAAAVSGALYVVLTPSM